MAGCASRAVSEQLPPELRILIDKITRLGVLKDQRWLCEELPAILEARIQTVMRQQHAEQRELDLGDSA